VRAGVVPRLCDDVNNSVAQSGCCLPVVYPGSQPLKTLAWLVRPPELDDEEAISDWVNQEAPSFERNPQRFVDLLAERGHRKAVIVVDQVEELFTLCNGTKARDAFVANLVNAAENSNVENTVILSMRSDYEPNLARTSLAEHFQSAELHVPPLTAGELRDAITKPAARVGLR
jgi:Cdc6-like AAA superfamily ATPase